MNLDLILNNLADDSARENFYRLQTALNTVGLLGPDWKFFDIQVTAASQKAAIPHGLKYTPTDIITLSIRGNYNFYFRYQDFDGTNIYVTSAGPVRLRFFAGSVQSFASQKLVEIPFVAPT